MVTEKLTVAELYKFALARGLEHLPLEVFLDDDGENEPLVTLYVAYGENDASELATLPVTLFA